MNFYRICWELKFFAGVEAVEAGGGGRRLANIEWHRVGSDQKISEGAFEGIVVESINIRCQHSSTSNAQRR